MPSSAAAVALIAELLPRLLPRRRAPRHLPGFEVIKVAGRHSVIKSNYQSQPASTSFHTQCKLQMEVLGIAMESTFKVHPFSILLDGAETPLTPPCLCVPWRRAGVVSRGRESCQPPYFLFASDSKTPQVRHGYSEDNLHNTGVCFIQKYFHPANSWIDKRV